MSKTVLIVEDEEDSRDILTTFLRHHGYRVLQAKGGKEGLHLAGEGQPDLIVMDLMLPELDGWETTERLKEDPKTAQIPVLALTVRALEEDQEKARAAGFDSYLIKPCEPVQVLQEIRRFIGPATREARP